MKSAIKNSALTRLNVKQTEERIGLSRQTFWRKYTANPPTFPLPHYIGNLRYWYDDELTEWEAKNVTLSPSHNNLEVVK